MRVCALSRRGQSCANGGVPFCTYCQRRTGSAFGISVYFKDENVDVYGIPRVQYEHRSDESGRYLRTEFCPRCGTTVTWTAEALPGMRAIAGGTFDDPKWFRIERHAWLRSGFHWIGLPSDVEQMQESPPLNTGKGPHYSQTKEVHSGAEPRNAPDWQPPSSPPVARR
jgi:hypothetical protein